MKRVLSDGLVNRPTPTLLCHCKALSDSHVSTWLCWTKGRSYRHWAFPVAGPTTWNSLPDNVKSPPSLSIFRQRLDTFLFDASLPDIIIDPR